MKSRFKRQAQLRLLNEIRITPLLNVALVLLFVVLLATPLLLNSSNAASAPKETITLAIDAKQALQLDQKPIERSQLEPTLAKLQQERPDLGVVVQLHRDLPVQVLVGVMADLQKAGVQRTAVVSSSESK